MFLAASFHGVEGGVVSIASMVGVGRSGGRSGGTSTPRVDVRVGIVFEIFVVFGIVFEVAASLVPTIACQAIGIQGKGYMVIIGHMVCIIWSAVPVAPLYLIIREADDL